MTYVLAALAGIGGAIVGYFASAFATVIIGELVGASNFEGALGMGAFLGVGPLGGLAGLLLGIWFALRWRGHTRPSAIARRLPVIVLGIAAPVAGGFWLAYEMRPELGTSSAVAPRLDFEIRFPAGMQLPAAPGRIRVQINTERNHQDGLVFDRTRKDGDRPVIVGSVDLYYRSSWRLLELKPTDGGQVYVFDLRLASRPTHMKEFGQWRPVDFVATGGPEQPREATAADGYEIRTRVVDREEEFKEQAAPRKP